MKNKIQNTKNKYLYSDLLTGIDTTDKDLSGLITDLNKVTKLSNPNKIRLKKAIEKLQINHNNENINGNTNINNNNNNNNNNKMNFIREEDLQLINKLKTHLETLNKQKITLDSQNSKFRKNYETSLETINVLFNEIEQLLSNKKKELLNNITKLYNNKNKVFEKKEDILNTNILKTQTVHQECTKLLNTPLSINEINDRSTQLSSKINDCINHYNHQVNNQKLNIEIDVTLDIKFNQKNINSLIYSINKINYIVNKPKLLVMNDNNNNDVKENDNTIIINNNNEKFIPLNLNYSKKARNMIGKTAEITDAGNMYTTCNLDNHHKWPKETWRKAGGKTNWKFYPKEGMIGIIVHVWERYRGLGDSRLKDSRIHSWSGSLVCLIKITKMDQTIFVPIDYEGINITIVDTE